MLQFIDDKRNCTGCTACFSVCPKKCIGMRRDEEGFLYPESNDSCIHCGLCEKVCPIKNQERRNRLVSNQLPYAAITKDERIWRRSASGGAFSEICNAFGDQDTVICGARWEGLKVVHDCIIGIDNIALFCKSKYVASDLGDVFQRIKSFLNNGRKVIFSGVPCQVAGLKSYLGKEYASLLTIDLICHGAGSPDVFLQCVHSMEEQFGGHISSYEFRAKRNVWEKDHLQKIDSENTSVYVVNDPYIQLFLSQNCLRPSCGENCKFRNINREGDITIADFKGLGAVFPTLSGSKKNYSTLVFNTDKGRSLIPIIEKTMEIHSCKLEDIEKYNPLFCKQTWFSENRDEFFETFIEDKEKAIKVYTHPAEIHKPSFARKVWSSLPVPIRKLIYQKLKHGGVSNDYESCVVSRIHFE
jgi:NAD-dependent dihydropyrimidine dehydrogenase PreA subunit